MWDFYTSNISSLLLKSKARQRFVFFFIIISIKRVFIALSLKSDFRDSKHQGSVNDSSADCTFSSRFFSPDPELCLSSLPFIACSPLLPFIAWSDSLVEDC